MKKYFYLILCVFYTAILHSQIIQHGLVREFNSGKKPIASVSIHFIGASSTESDIEGRFKLTFDSNRKKYGDPISFAEAKKIGYEVVNETQMHSLSINSNDTLRTDLILAKAGVIQTAKAEYAGASLKALTQGYEREKAALLKNVNAAQIKEEEYNEQIRLLSEEYEKQQARLDALAQTFARVNFDDVSPTYKEALELYKEGKLDEAIAKLESQDLAKQTRDILLEIKRIANAKAQIASDERILTEKKNQHIEMLSSLADMYNLNYNPIKAEGIMDTLLLLDSTNVNILHKAADFYQDQYKYTKARILYLKVINHRDANQRLIGKSYLELGKLVRVVGDYETAESNLNNSYDIFKALVKSDSLNSDIKTLSLICYELALFNVELGRFELGDQFITYYHRYSEYVAIELGDFDFFSEFFNSIGKQGLMHQLNGHFDKALNCYTRQKDGFHMLSMSDTTNLYFKQILGVSYQDLGYVSLEMDDKYSALQYFKEYHKIAQFLNNADTNSLVYLELLATSNQWLGKVYFLEDSINLALIYFKDFIHYSARIHNKYPEYLRALNGLVIALQHTGDLYLAMDSTELAKEAYLKSIIFSEKLLDKGPCKSEYLWGYSMSIVNYSVILFDDSDFGAIIEKYKDLSRKISSISCNTYLKSITYYEELGKSLRNLGQAYNCTGDFELAIDAIQNEVLTYSTAIRNGVKSQHLLADQINAYLNLIDLSIYVGMNDSLTILYFDSIDICFKYLNEIDNSDKRLYKLKRKVNESSRNSYFNSIIPSIRIAVRKNYDYCGTYGNYNRLFRLYNKLLAHWYTEDKYFQNPKYLDNTIYYAMRSGHFREVEGLIRDAIAVNLKNKFLYTNLPPALLFQGKIEEATVLYQQYALQPFGEQGLGTYKDAFLDNIKAFEEAGIIPDNLKEEVGKIKRMLEGM